MQGPYETFVHMLALTAAAPTKLRERRSLINESMGTTTTTTRRRHLVLATKFKPLFVHTGKYSDKIKVVVVMVQMVCCSCH